MYVCTNDTFKKHYKIHFFKTSLAASQLKIRNDACKEILINALRATRENMLL
jgi:hypothetical protein